MGSGEIASILETSSDSGVRYVVVGGVAVVLHGHLRLTADLDLVVALERENVLAAIEALTAIGYRPRPAVDAKEFADPEIRTQWVRDEGTVVFSLWSPSHPGTDIDLFVDGPFPFDAFRECARVTSVYGVSILIASIADLIAMKSSSGRPEDLADIAALERIAHPWIEMNGTEESKPDPWEQHRLEQTRSWLRLTPEQRLEWLEGAKAFAREALGAAYRQPPNGEGRAEGDPR